METKLSKIIGLIIIGLFAFVTMAILFVPLRNTELAHLIVGDLIGMSTMLVGFYWGSSSGSKEKQEQLNKTKDAN